MADKDLVTFTLKMPRELRESAHEALADYGISLSAYIRLAMRELVEKRPQITLSANGTLQTKREDKE